MNSMLAFELILRFNCKINYSYNVLSLMEMLLLYDEKLSGQFTINNFVLKKTFAMFKFFKFCT